MANLSNINNKFIVTNVGTGQAIVGATNAATGSTLTVGGAASFSGSITSGIGNNFDPIIREGRVVANPAYSFTGDLDTGMFNPNLSNTIAFGTGGVERLRIDSDGNATFAGNTLLDGLASNGYRIYKIRLQAPYTGGWGSITPGTVIGGLQQTNFRTDGGASNIAAAVDFELESNTYGTGQTRISFKCGGVNGVNSTEKMRITSEGSVIVGTATVAAANAAADNIVIKGEGNAVGLTISNSVNSGTGTIFFGDVASSAAAGFRYNHNTGDMAVSAEDNITFACDRVGIGTTSPGSYDAESDDLVVVSGVDDVVPTPGITIACSGNQTALGRGALRFADGINGNQKYRGALEYNHNGDYMFFRTVGLEKIRINSTGDIYNVPQTNTYQSTFFGINTGNQSASTGLYNQSFGYEAAYANTTGEKNTGVGHRSLYNSTTSSRNTAIGYQTLYNLNNTGSDNTAIGYAAANSLTNAERNVFVGGFCGASVVTNSYNTALGYHAFRYGSGDQNTAIGYYALGTSTNVSGILNTAVGIRSSEDMTTGNSNVSVGGDSLGNCLTGTSNVAIGVEAAKNFLGSTITAVGYFAANLVSVATVTNFTAIGYLAGRFRTLGVDNTAIGAFSQYGATSGSNPSGCCNTSVGSASLYNISVGVQNTAIGRQAGYYITNGNNNTLVGHNTALSMVGGYNNTCIGSAAGDILTIGNNNTCLGYNSDTPSNSSTNTIVLGNSAITSLQCNATLSGLSDERDKTNIKDSEYGLDIIDSLKPVTFEWNQRDGNKKGLNDLGFIAQDLQKIDDKHLNLVNDENPEKLLASYSRLIPVLVKSIQELKAELDLLKNK